MENSMVISNKVCYVEIIGVEGEYISADLSIITKDGKCGLLHNSKMNIDERDPDYESALTLPIEYENLFFIESDKKTYVVAVADGKQGLFKLQAHKNGFFEEVIAKALLQCAYDRIEAARKNNILFLYSQNKISCYSPREQKMLTVCDEVEEPCREYLLCKRGKNYQLWNTFGLKWLTSLPIIDEFCYEGTYEAGDVFKLRYWDEDSQDCVSQLLFCEFYVYTVHFSHKAKQLAVMTKTGASERRLVRVEMSWGDGDSMLPFDIVDEISKESVTL